MKRFLSQIGKIDFSTSISTLHEGENHYDLVVIGGGPGGYVASIKAAQLGLDVACVEMESLGGTCLNIGCIPSKALLHASEIYEELDHMKDWGIGVSCTDDSEATATLDCSKLQKTKGQVVRRLVKGVEHLFKKNGVDWYHGKATLQKTEGDVLVAMNPSKKDDDNTPSEILINAHNIIIATGSDVSTLPFLPVDEQVILSSTGALDLDHVPENMAVVGTGAISLELGSVWNRFGAEVDVFYYKYEVARYLDDELRPLFRKALEKSDMNFFLDTDVTDCVITEDGKARLEYCSIHEPDAKEYKEYETVLVGVGRKPYFDGVGAEDIGVEFTSAGQIAVDDTFQTSVENVYAIGDVIPGPMLAHKAEEDGIMCVEWIAEGKKPHVDYMLVPSVVYTNPEVAMVGYREQDLEEGTYNVGKFHFAANGRAKAMLVGDGMVKVIACKETDKLLGMHMIGPHVSEMIMEGALIMHAGLTVNEIAEACHPHPTLSEAIKEACMDCVGDCIHS